MKKNVTLVLVVCAILGQSTSLFSQKHNLGKFRLEQSATDPDGGSKTKLQSITEALEWRSSLLQDESGNVIPEYHLNAMKQANQMRGNSAQRSSSLQWEELGPGNIGGRTRAVIYDKRDTSRKTIYVGAVGGGVWKSVNGGNNWAQLGSVSSCLAVSCMSQGPDGTIYFGTGEGLAQPSATSRNSGQVGNGLHMLYGADLDSVLPSTIPSQISNSVGWCMINRIAVNPTNAQDIYVATSGGGGNGLQHSSDGGQTWTQIGTNSAPIIGLGSNYAYAADVKFSADGINIFASVGQAFGFPGVRFIMSQDGGASWSAPTLNNFPQFPSSVWRIEIATAPSNSNVVYIVVAINQGELGAIYKSADAGSTWTVIGTAGGILNAPFGGTAGTGGQGWYDNVIAVNPFDEDKVYFGGTQLFTYTSLAGWSLASVYFADPSNPQWVHPDMHAIVFNDKDKNEMFVGCDGGVFKSNDAFSAFPNPNYTVKNRGYAVTENYSVAADLYGSVLGGAQDNGTNYVDYLRGGTTYATNVYGGDGVYAEISHFDPNIFVGGYVNGNDFRSSTKGVAWVPVFDEVINPGTTVDPASSNDPSVCTQPSGQNAPFVTSFWLEESTKAYNSIDSVSFSDTLTHYAGETLTLTSRIKQTFHVTLTDSIPANTSVKFVDPLKSRLYFATGCGLWMTPDVLDFGNTPRWFRITRSTDDVKSLTSSPTGDTIYFAGNAKVNRMTGLNSVLAFDTATKGNKDLDLQLNLTSGFTSAIVQVTTASRYLEGIYVDRNDPTHVLVAVAGYSNAGTPHVYHSFNSGTTWTSASGDLPNMPVYQCVIDAYNSSHYIIGSELGVWDSYDNGTTWTEQNAGINARVPVYRLRQQNYLSEDCYALYLGTHGRGMWRSTTLLSAAPNGCLVYPLGVDNTPKNVINNMMVYPNPVTAGSTKVLIDLETSSSVTLRVIDMPGRVLHEASYGNLGSGKNELILNTSNLANGTYLVVGTLSNGQTMTRAISVNK
jgi:photosystem II stability/assembly factor-like uncharacterized protein